MAWDASFKNFLKKYLDTEVITEIDVPTANLRLDFLMRNRGDLPSPFKYAKQTILGEFKSERDKFSLSHFYQGVAKGYLHLSSVGHWKRDSLSLMFILGGGISIPQDLVSECRQIEKGVYFLFRDFQIILVELDKLDYDQSNDFLGIFASSITRRSVIAKALRNKERFIISYSYFLFKDEVVEVAKAENIEIDPRSLSIRAAVESIGIDRIIEEVGVERLLDGLTPEQVQELRESIERRLRKAKDGER